MIGGRGMHVAHSADELRVEGPCLVDRYLEGALELDVDALCDGEDAWVAAVLEHVEPTGRPLGRLGLRAPGPSVSEALEVEIREVASRDRRGARRARPDQPPARAARREALRARGEPARVADGAVRREGDRRPARRARGAAAARRAARRRSACPSARSRRAPGRRRPSSRRSASPALRPAGPEMRSTGEVMAGAATAVARRTRAPSVRPAASKRGGTIGPPLQSSSYGALR